MNTKVRDLTFNYEEDDFKTFLSFIVDSKESQEVMYSVLGLIDECNLLTKGCCEVLLGKEYKAYPGYITSKEAVLEIISNFLLFVKFRDHYKLRFFSFILI